MRPSQPEAPSGDLFRSSLEAILAPEHDLIRLAALIDWERFDDAFGPFYRPGKGRRGLRTRLMAGLHLLKHMKGLSDEETCAAWLENPSFQAFCGETHFQHRLPLDRSSMTRWRRRIGPGDLEALLAETIAVAVKTKAVSQRQLERITVDTTVQTKAVAHPTDSHLILRSIEWLNRLAKRHGVKLRQSFIRLATRARREASRLMHTRGHKQALRWVRKMKTWLGRLIRDINRKIAGNEILEAAFKSTLERAERILAQKPGDKDKLYVFHAPEVECIGKGKARTRYAFGVKTSIATTNERCKGGQFVIGAMVLPGNPYDGHTLAGQIDQVAKLTGAAVKRAYVDRGYRGHKIDREGLDIAISHTRGVTSPTVRSEMRRRNGIEPVIGHLEDDGHLERNHLAGPEGDAINAILCAAGHNLRLLARWLRIILLRLITWALFARAKPEPAVGSDQHNAGANQGKTSKITGDDRASFRRFCEVSRNEAVRERTAFVRFRRELRRFDLDTLLFEEITVHLKAQAMTVKTRTLVDATVVQSASERALPEDPGAVYDDSAYRGKVFADAVKERGGTAHVVATSIWAKNDPASQAEAERLLAEHNSAIHKVRCRVKKIFGTWKRSYSLRRMRWRGLTNARLQTHLTAIAYNLKRTLNILNPA